VNLTLAQRAQGLAQDLLLSSYEPAPDVPTPGSAAWMLAVDKMARHFLHLFQARKHELLRSGTPPAMPALGPGAAAATKALLQQIAREARP
jgi:hypothetical protein